MKKIIQHEQELYDIAQFLADNNCGSAFDYTQAQKQILESIVHSENRLKFDMDKRMDFLKAKFDGNFISFREMARDYFCSLDVKDRINELIPKLHVHTNYYWSNSKLPKYAEELKPIGVDNFTVAFFYDLQIIFIQKDRHPLWQTLNHLGCDFDIPIYYRASEQKEHIDSFDNKVVIVDESKIIVTGQVVSILNVLLKRHYAGHTNTVIYNRYL